MITSDYGRSASDTPRPRTPAAQLQLAGVNATSSRIGAVQVSAWVHTTSPHRRCAQAPTPINFDDPDISLLKAALADRQDPLAAPGFNRHFSSEHQIAAINAATLESICEARSLLWFVAANIRLLNLLRQAMPDEPVIKAFSDTFNGMYITRILLLMYPYREGPPLQWGIDSKNLIMLMVEEQVRKTWIAMRDAFAADFVPHIESLVAQLKGR